MLRTAFFVTIFFMAVALPLGAQRVAINEILFNPKPGAEDYVELYNRSDSAVDISTLFLTNKGSGGGYGPLKKLSDTTRLLLRGGYVVFTEDAAALARHYFLQAPDAVIQIASMPSYPNAAGTVVLLDTAKRVLDEVAYNEDWHFELLADAEGVALERIDAAGPSNSKSNWHSASSDAGWGTPGYRNSAVQLFQNRMLHITVSPKIFSPDGDGQDETVSIAYAAPESGAVANVFVYDVSGKEVRHLVKNGVLGTLGSFTWNGLDERNRRLPAGQYIVATEVFTLQGTKQRFKNVVVLARRLN